ncbi:MAG: zinc ABC transporter substrate-binding protein [Erysipelotrichaceae bacterium]
MKKKLLLVALLSISLLSACSPSKPKICSNVYPIHYLITQIGGDYVDTCTISDNTIIQRAQITKDFEKQLDAADALFYIGGLAPYMELYLDDIRSTNVNMVDLGTRSFIYKFKRYTTTNISGSDVTNETPYYEGEVFANLDVYNKDPMIWLDPIAMTSMGSTIRDYFIKEYPEYTKVFEDNYDKLEYDLARLDSEFQGLKNNKKPIQIVTMTPSFGYWQKPYGIQIYPIVLSKFGALPGDAQLKEIKQRIISDGVRYIAYEENMPDDMKALYEQIKSELGLISVNLSNISSITNNDIKANKNYLSIMYENLNSLESIER